MTLVLPKVSYLVLDFNKPFESRNCLESIKKYSLFDYQVIYLSNGGQQDYVWQYYQEGLIDRLIFNKNNWGLGYGTETLFGACDTEFSIYHQNDQEIGRVIEQREIDMLIETLNNKKEYGAIGLAGTPCGPNIYSERSSIINTKFYNSIPKTHGGCGPFNHLKYNEQAVQEFFKENQLSFPSLNPPWVIDRGVFTIRELPCGGIVKQRTDTKAVWWDKIPKQSYMFPEMNESEWKLSIEGNWIGGTIPQKYLDKNESFNCWG